MNPEFAFLRQIAAEPGNALHRLIFADWLEEQGDPRAELIRLQEQLRKIAVPDRPRAEARMHELLDQGVQPLRIIRENCIGLELTLIFPGEFLMGSPPDEPGRGEDEAQVAVTLTQPFWLGTYQVTQSEWQQVIGTSLDDQWEIRSGGSHPVGEGPRHPIYYVSWQDAVAFCDRLTERDRQARLLGDDWAYTLPSEAQWEYACRAGTTTPVYCGNSLGSHQANFRGSGPYNGAPEGPWIGETVPVGSYPPNPWGLHDMHANLTEWCRDGLRKRLRGGVDPEVQSRGPRVHRGGTWFTAGYVCRSASRAASPADERGYNDVGFRVALCPTSGLQ